MKCSKRKQQQPQKHNKLLTTHILTQQPHRPLTDDKQTRQYLCLPFPLMHPNYIGSQSNTDKSNKFFCLQLALVMTINTYVFLTSLFIGIILSSIFVCFLLSLTFFFLFLLFALFSTQATSVTCISKLMKSTVEFLRHFMWTQLY